MYAVCAGYIIGGILGLAMMMLRGQLHRNLGNVNEIFRGPARDGDDGPRGSRISGRTHAERRGIDCLMAFRFALASSAR